MQCSDSIISTSQDKNTFRQGTPMVTFVKISKDGSLLEIKDVSDTYRDRHYYWENDE